MLDRPQLRCVQLLQVVEEGGAVDPTFSGCLALWQKQRLRVKHWPWHFQPQVRYRISPSCHIFTNHHLSLICVRRLLGWSWGHVFIDRIRSGEDIVACNLRRISTCHTASQSAATSISIPHSASFKSLNEILHTAVSPPQACP